MLQRLLSLCIVIPAFLLSASAYVTNSASNTVSIVDTTSNTVIGTITVDYGPTGIAISGNTAYVANYYGGSGYGSVSVINLTNNTTSLITDPSFNSPSIIAIGGNYAYVTNYSGGTGNGSVSVINLTSNTVTAVINDPSFNGPVGIVIVGNYAYVAEWGSLSDPGSGNTVTVIDTRSNAVIDNIVVGPVGISPYNVAANNSYVYVADNSNINGSIPGFFSVIDATTNTLVLTTEDTRLQYPGSVALGGNYAYMSNNGGTTLVVIDTGSNTIVNALPISTSGFGYGVAVYGNNVYVCNAETGGSVSVLDTQTNSYITVADPMVTFAQPTWVAVPPTPPPGFRGKQMKNNFGVVSNIFNRLKWNSPNNPGIMGYVLMRNGAPIATLAPSTTQYDDSKNIVAGSYTYSIYSYDSAGNISTTQTLQVGH
jgi:YVTN family beta-propeller protein